MAKTETTEHRFAETEYGIDELLAHAKALFGVQPYVAAAAHRHMPGRPERVTKSALAAAIAAFLNRKVG